MVKSLVRRSQVSEFHRPSLHGRGIDLYFTLVGFETFIVIMVGQQYHLRIGESRNEQVRHSRMFPAVKRIIVVKSKLFLYRAISSRESVLSCLFLRWDADFCRIYGRGLNLEAPIYSQKCENSYFYYFSNRLKFSILHAFFKP